MAKNISEETPPMLLLTADTLVGLWAGRGGAGRHRAGYHQNNGQTDTQTHTVSAV